MIMMNMTSKEIVSLDLNKMCGASNRILVVWNEVPLNTKNLRKRVLFPGMTVR